MHYDMQHHTDEALARREFLRKAFMATWVNMISGDYAEFGCCGATTFRCAYQASRGNLLKPHLWAFDSFQGLPPSDDGSEHPRWVRGAMSMTREQFDQSLAFHGIEKSDYTVISGFYSETLSTNNLDSTKYCPDISIAYVDCDMYSSTTQVLEFLKQRLKNGMIIAFDDYYCYWKDGISGERLAFLDFEKTLRAEYNFLPLYNFGWHGQSFVVESRKYIPGHSPVGHL